MTVAMSELNYEKLLIYLDDLICFGRNLESHNKKVDIFERLRKVAQEISLFDLVTKAVVEIVVMDILLILKFTKGVKQIPP